MLHMGLCGKVGKFGVCVSVFREISSYVLGKTEQLGLCVEGYMYMGIILPVVYSGEAESFLKHYTDKHFCVLVTLLYRLLFRFRRHYNRCLNFCSYVS